MINATVQPNHSQLNRINAAFKRIPRKMPRLLTQSVNYAGRRAKVQTAKAITTKVNMKAAAAKKRITLDKATKSSHPAAVIKIKGGKLPLIALKPNQNKKGVSFKIYKDQARQVEAGSFIQTMKSGHVGVFKRKAGPRLPIRELYTDSYVDEAVIVCVFKGHRRNIKRTANKNLKTETNRLIGREMDKLN